MGWANSVPIFHEDVTFILQEEIPHITIPYIDDSPIKGPKSQYLDDAGVPETIPQNPGIRCFIWEHFHNLNHIVQHMWNFLWSKGNSMHMQNTSSWTLLHS